MILIYIPTDLCYIKNNELDIDGLESVLLIFSKDEKLLAISTTFGKYKF